MKTIHLIVNGRPIQITCPPGRSLLKVLRQDLRLTGAKEGCGKGQCGACAVLLDGKAVMSCKQPIGKCQGKEVVTIEGIGSLSAPHVIQSAFAKTGAVQCGFCIPGMIVRSKALLDQNPKPDRREIAQALHPHLCRCTGYQKIFEAVELAAAKLRGEEVDIEPLGRGADSLGKEVARADALAKAAGATLFADDIPVADCAYLKIVRSPHHHALIKNIDAAKALAVPGALAVLTARDVAGSNILKMAGDDQPLLCADRVRMKGDPVAAVAALTEESALAALDLVEVAYEPLPAALSLDEAMAPHAPQLHANRPNLFFEQPILFGDPAKGWEEAEVVLERRYATSAVEHAYLENDAGIAYVDDKDRLVVMCGSQNIHQHRKTIAEALGLDLARVRIIQTPTGGAFGGKLDVSVGGALGLAALKLRRPVRLSYSREETFACTTKRHPFEMKAKIGARRDGGLVALEMEVLAETGAYMSFAKSVVTRGIAHAGGPYRFQHAKVIGRAAYVNSAIKGAMRGFGVPQTAFAIESLLDELAHELKMNPLSIRQKNGFAPGDVSICGQTLDDAHGFLECLAHMKPHYERALREARNFTKPGLKRGVGLAAVWFGPGKSSPDRSEAWAELLPNDDLQVWIGAADMGQGAETMFWQIAAQAMGYPLERVRVCTTDTDRTPDGNYSAGSRQTYVSGRAVELAVGKLKKLLADHGVSSYEEARQKGLATMCKVEHFTETSNLDPKSGQGAPWETYSYGIQMAEVEVDAVKGKVRVDRITAVHDVGTVINRLNVEGQIHGGVAMGLGYALSEKYVYDKTDSFAKYRVPRAKDMPAMEVVLVQVPRRNGPFGASGTGEFADVPTAPAIANAIFHACGVRVRRLPVDPALLKA